MRLPKLCVCRCNSSFTLQSMIPHAVRRLKTRLLRLPTWGSNGLRVRRMRRHLRQVAKDDELLMQEDKGGRLAQLELLEALHERGM